MLSNTLKYILLLNLMPLLLLNVTAQQTIVSGTIPGGESADIKIFAYKDYLSYRPQVLNRTKVDSSGNFTIEIKIRETRQVFLQIEHYSLGLYVEPDAQYVLECDSIFISDQYRPLYNNDPLPCRHVVEPDPGLNALISDFNIKYNEFIVTEFGGIYQRRNTNIIKTFRAQMIDEISQYDNAFLSDYVIYKMAIVELAMAPAKKAALFSLLIKDKEVKLFHPEYMNFFHEFYDHQMFPDNKFISRAELSTLINYQFDYPALIDSLGKDSTLRNEVVRELVCMNMLAELYTSNEFHKANILTYLDYIRKNTKFRDHVSIAENLKKELTLLKKGYSTPPFEMADLNGQVFSIEEFKGKPVYINFFTTWSFGCLAELELMKALEEQYRNRVHFVSISLDRKQDIVKELVNEKDYSWTFLFNGADEELLNDYRIKTFPTFLLLDENGKVVEYPAYKPSEIIRDSFDQLLGGK